MAKKIALIAGSTGIVGLNLANHLAQQEDWAVYGLARKPSASADVQAVAADLLDPASLATALRGIHPTHVFITTWMRQPTEAENIKVNRVMVRNLLDAVSKAKTVEHVGLVTGLKHYLGPFEAYGKGKMPPTPFREEQGRQQVENFYYEQEDRLFDAASRFDFTWSVHRPHTVIGYALGNAMNMGVTLAVYAALCKQTGQPFVFPGSATQWNGLTDMTDARLLVRHLEWASTSEQGRNEDFNVVNGDVFRWQWMWSQIADYFGIEAAPFDGVLRPLESRMQDSAQQWQAIATQFELKEPAIEKLVSWWHTDADLGRPMEVLTDMSKSRKAGFLAFQSTLDAFIDLFERLKVERAIPR